MFGLNSFSAAPFSDLGDSELVANGVSGTGAVGSVTATTGANVSVTGVSATGTVGGVQIDGDSTANAGGIAATASVGSVVAQIPATVNVTGVSASMPMTSTDGGGSLLGGLALVEEPMAALANAGLQIIVREGVGVAVTGVSATGAVGSATVQAKANVSVTGVSATGGVGSVTVEAAGQVSVTGVSATGAVGSVTVGEGSGVSVATGSLRVIASVGVAQAIGEISVPVTGVEATGAVGQVNILTWNNITPNQTANWVEIAA